MNIETTPNLSAGELAAFLYTHTSQCIKRFGRPPSGEEIADQLQEALKEMLTSSGLNSTRDKAQAALAQADDGKEPNLLGKQIESDAVALLPLACRMLVAEKLYDALVAVLKDRDSIRCHPSVQTYAKAEKAVALANRRLGSSQGGLGLEKPKGENRDR